MFADKTMVLEYLTSSCATYYCCGTKSTTAIVGSTRRVAKFQKLFVIQSSLLFSYYGNTDITEVIIFD